MAKNIKKYELAHGLTFNHGTSVARNPPGTRVDYATACAVVLIALDRDTTAELTMPWDEAVKLGWVKEVP